MKYSSLVILPTLVFSAIVFADPIEKPPEVTAYEECALQVFETSKKVSDVFKQCEPEMEAYLSLQDEKMRDVMKQRAMASTQRELRGKDKKNSEK